MTGYHLAVSCPLCGGSVDHVADGRPCGDVTSAVAGCVDCGRHWLLRATLERVAVEPDRHQGRLAL